MHVLHELYKRDLHALPTACALPLGRVWRTVLSGEDCERAFAAAEVATLLDLRHSRQVAGVLEGLAQRVVLVTHDLELLRGWQRVLVIEQGRVVADGSADQSIGHYEALMAVERQC